MTVNQYQHKDGRGTFGAEAGTEMDSVLAASPDWELVDGKSSSASDQDATGQDPANERDQTPTQGDSEDDGLDGKSRAELNDLATQAGVDAPDKLPNKQAVIDAIRGA